MGTQFQVANKCGAKKVQLIKVLRKRKNRAELCMKARVSVIEIESKSPIKKGSKHIALISTLRASSSRKNGSVIRFCNNTVVIMDENGKKMQGTRIVKPIADEIRAQFPEIASKAVQGVF